MTTPAAMKPYDEEMARAMTANEDWPRSALMEGWDALIGRPDAPPIRQTPYQNPADRGLSGNHSAELGAGEAARCVALGIDHGPIFGWYVDDLRARRLRGSQHGEQLSGVYTTYWVAADVVFRVAAARAGDAAAVAEADYAIGGFLGLADLLDRPMTAHRLVAGRMMATGCRVGDSRGADDRRDAAAVALGERPRPPSMKRPRKIKWTKVKKKGKERLVASGRSQWLEVEIIEEAVAMRLIPTRITSHLPRVQIRTIVEECANGMRVWNDDLGHCWGFPMWSLAIRDSDGAYRSVGHHAHTPPGVDPAKMGGGRAPEPPADLPGLGGVLRRVELGPRTPIAFDGQPAPDPGPGPERPPQPPDEEEPVPKPPKPKPPAGGGPTIGDMKLGPGGDRALTVARPGKPTYMVNLLPGTDPRAKTGVYQVIGERPGE